MWSLNVVSGWWIYCLPHNEVSLLLLLLCFLAVSSLLSVQFRNLFFILVLQFFLDFSILIRERLIFVCFQHLAMQMFPRASEELFQESLDRGWVMDQ